MVYPVHSEFGNIVLHFKKIYNRCDANYVFKLCCKAVINVENECPGQELALKIPKCLLVEEFDTVFCVEPTKHNKLVFRYQTLNVDDEVQCPEPVDIGGCFLIHFSTDNTEHENRLCILELCIPVTTDCLDACNIGRCVALENFISIVCVK